MYETNSVSPFRTLQGEKEEEKGGEKPKGWEENPKVWTCCCCVLAGLVFIGGVSSSAAVAMSGSSAAAAMSSSVHTVQQRFPAFSNVLTGWVS